MCADKTTYRLERATVAIPEDNGGLTIVKRSADAEGSATNEHFDFAEFTGTKMIKYNILNLADV